MPWNGYFWLSTLLDLELTKSHVSKNTYERFFFFVWSGLIHFLSVLGDRKIQCLLSGYWGGKTHPQCGQHHSTGWSFIPNTRNKVSCTRASMCLSISWLWMQCDRLLFPIPCLPWYDRLCLFELWAKMNSVFLSFSFSLVMGFIKAAET